MLREERYLVQKWHDIYKYLSEEERYQLEKINTRIYHGRLNDKKDPSPEFVCIRSTWPEYETVWKMIEDRVDSENSVHS